ncbi:leucine-rich repeat-containing protein 40 [Aspergillus steynii IBT 23096]|uniref:Leucine-rich repeat-containing protein 40 n=1 Tax=Aspergillus steynii IBT 23096 TaxID=1392250 RepID=A0A2I2GCE5_9EURO|nr:leucine-rich repeat-containing protein 40 [Aspergillus steynii IBT 23096]PLB50554.1 leucine-rich repeat-containing protein 40 [Aspergillus steynii IBT 23096]
MDRQQKPLIKPSGIPRLASKLPLPTATASRSIRASPSREKLQTDPGLYSGRLRRPSEEPVFKKPLPKYKSPDKPSNGQQQKREVLQIGTIPSEQAEPARATSIKADNDECAIPMHDADNRGRTRPSLSERTIETLSQIPPSPAPLRRQSSFFNATSPMRSPSRPPSSMTNYSRSPSRSSSSRQPSGNDYLSRPSSAMRLPSRSRPSTSTNGSSADVTTPMAMESPSKLKQPSIRAAVHDETTPTKPKPRALFSQPSTTRVSSDAGPSIQVKKTRKTPVNSSAGTKPTSVTSRQLSTKQAASELTPSQQSELETRKVSNSSSALRESIARAKAARKAAAQTVNTSPASTWDNFDVEDPFNQRPKDPQNGLIRKRIETGRTSGHLNIAAMSLTELPKEVMAMYDFDPESSTEWYESVDLVKFIAADNEFTELPDAAFPDRDVQDLESDADEKGNQFGGLELLDLHGNLLRSLPMGLRRLQRLHTLNLSNNSLTMHGMHVIVEMESLRDLRLAKNQLQGKLTSDIGHLKNLETLDLHNNSITDLPEELRSLKCLRFLNVGNNQLASLPFEALSQLPLKDLNAQRNKLSGTLIPANVTKLETLQNLDVSSNALVQLSGQGDIELPSLQTLAISMNRIQKLPSISRWRELLTLSAEDNKICEIPHGFVELKSIKNVDFTGNDISKLDERIGLIESLSTFRIANNPLRERRFLGMSTEDLKRDLRNRCEPEVQDTDDEEGSVATQFTLAPETPAQTSAWQIKPGGTLDRSYTDMRELEVERLDEINFEEIRCLCLQHNGLRSFPAPALSMLAANLTDLDLSNNPLDSNSLLSSSLMLPSLQHLNLSATTLTTLTPVFAYLKAPSLTFLDVSYNRLSGPLPPARLSYPNLMTLLAADNRLDGIDFDAVQGLQVLDVGNNNIGSLPPKIGLLRAEGSSKNWGGGSALRRFEIAGNSFRVPRWQIVAKGTDTILEWLKDRIPAIDLCEWESGDEATS